MTEIEIKTLVRNEIRKQMDIILSGSAGNATATAEDIQNLYPGMPGNTGRPVMHPYGFSSLAPDGTIQVTARQGEHTGNRLVLGHRAADRPSDLSSGESCLYSKSGYRVVARGGSLLVGKGKVLEPAVLGNTLTELLTNLLNYLIVHTHAAPGCPPTNQLDFQTLLTDVVEKNKILVEDGGGF